MPDRDWWSALWPDPEDTLRKLGVEAETDVLDLCCGDGYFTAPLAGMTGGRIAALDLHPEMIKLAKAEVERQGATVRQWITGDAMNVSRLLDGPVDLVLMANTFHGVPDKTALAKEVRKSFKSGGTFAVVNWQATPREETIVLGAARGPATVLRMTPTAVGEAVEAGGFNIDRLVELPPYHYAVIFRLKP